MFLGIGYSVLTQVIKINGTANISSTWKVVSTKVKELELKGATTTDAPLVSNGTTLNLGVQLDKPGSQAIYEVSVENQGTLDAVVRDIKTNDTTPEDLTVYVNELITGEELKAGKAKTFQVVVTWDSSLTSSTSSLSKDIKITIDFEQKTGSDLKPELTVPTYIVDIPNTTWSNSKKVTITYPEGENFIYQYSTDGGISWKTVLTKTYVVTYTNNGTLMIRVSDGKSSLTTPIISIEKVDSTKPNVSISGNTETWSTSKTLTITATDKESGLASSPYSYDGGNTWQVEATKTYTSNQTVNIWVKDKAGNIAKQTVTISKIDTVAPTNVTLTKGSVTSSSITVTASATQNQMGIRGYQFSIDGGAYSTEQTSVSKTYTGLSKNTSHSFKVKAIGKNGKSTESTVLTVSTNDISVPTYSVSPSGDIWAQSKIVTITYPGTKTENLVYEYSKDGGSTWTSVTNSSASVTFTSNGNVIARIRDTENTANTVTASTFAVSKIDTVAPTFTVSGNTTSWTDAKTLTITASDETGGSGLASSPYSFDGGSTWQSGNAKSFTTNQTVNIWVKDNAGNIGKQSIVINKIDTVAPTNVTLTKGTVTSSSITVIASATQPNMGIRGYQFSIDGGAYSAEQTSATKTYTGLSKNTSHAIKVKAIGNNGKSTESTAFSVTTSNISSPTYSINPTGDTWASSKTVTITYPGTKTDNLVYEYSTNGGTSWTNVTTSSKTVTFTSNGTIIARIRDTGNAENDMTASTFTVSKIDTVAPTFSVSGNTTDWTISKTLAITNPTDAESGLASSPYSFDGGSTWQTTTSKTFTTNQTVNIWVKDNAGNIGKQSVVISKIDTVAPTDVTLTKGAVTSSSITITASATQPNMGIRGYQFSMDGGAYETEQVSPTKVFTGLTKNKTYTFKVRAIGNNGTTTESTNMSVTTSNISVPTYSVNPAGDTWATSKTVTITYPGTKTSNLVYEYSKDGGTNWTSVSTSPATVTFTSNGSVIARIRDTGNNANTVTASTFTVSKIDITAPTFSVSGNTTDWSVSKTLTITASDETNGSGLAAKPYSFDGGTTWQDSAFKTYSTNQTVNIWVKDNAGNIAKQAIIINKIDTVAPSNVTLTKGSVTSSSITVSASATQANMGIRGYQFSIDGGTYSAEQTNNSKTFTGLTKNKAYSIKVKVIGKNGLSTESSALSVTTSNITAPTYAISPAAATWAMSKTVTITYSGTKTSNLVYEYSKDGGTNWTSVSTSPATVTFTSNGSVIARIRDTGNNANTVTASTFTVSKIDTTVPTFSVSGNTAGWTTSKTLTITNPKDTESGLASSPYSFDGGSTWGTTTSKSFTTNQTVNVWVKDIAGNIAKQAIAISKIDTVAPTNVTLTKGTVTSSSITVTASATQTQMGIRGYQFSIDGGTYGTEQTSVSKTFTGLSKNTSHTFKVKAIGKNGKATESSALSVTTSNITAPTYSIDPAADTWATSKTVTITYPGTKTSNLVYEYSIDGGTNWTAVSASPASVKFTSNRSVIARIRDTGNSANTVTASTFTVSKIDTTPPTFRIKGDTTTWEKTKTLTFADVYDSESGVDDSGSPYSFDGGNTWQSTPAKSFTSNQTANLWLIDRVGNIGKQTSIINRVDDVAPTNVNLVQGSITSSSITVTASATQPNMGIRGYQFSIDGGAYSAEQTSVSKTYTGLSKNKSYSFKVKVWGKNGKSTESSTLITTTSNITTPIYSFSSGSADTWAQSKSVLITFERIAQSNHIYEYSTNGGTSWSTSNEASIVIPFSSNGTLIARIRDTENSANTVTASTFTVSKIDNKAPGFIVGGNTTSWTTTKTLTIGSIEEDESGLASSPYSFDGETTWTSTSTKEVTTNETMNIWVKDLVGNIGKQSIIVSKIDTVAPSNVTLTKGSVTSNSISVTASATQSQMGIRGYQFSINNGSWSTEQTSVTKVFTGLNANTTYSIKVRVWGKNGRYTDSSTLSVTTESEALAAPTYIVTPSGSVPANSKTVKINYPSPKPSGAVYAYSQDGGVTWTTVSSTSTTLTYTMSGTLIARVVYNGTTTLGQSLAVTNVGKYNSTATPTSTSDTLYISSITSYSPGSYGYGVEVCFAGLNSSQTIQYEIGNSGIWKNTQSRGLNGCYTTDITVFQYQNLYSIRFRNITSPGYSKVSFCYGKMNSSGLREIACTQDPTVPSIVPTSSPTSTSTSTSTSTTTPTGTGGTSTPTGTGSTSTPTGTATGTGIKPNV